MGFIHAHESALIGFFILAWLLLGLFAWALVAGGADRPSPDEDEERRHEWGSDWKDK